jgi:hypothetical protein
VRGPGEKYNLKAHAGAEIKGSALKKHKQPAARMVYGAGVSINFELTLDFLENAM